MCQGNQMGSLMKQEGYKYGCYRVIRLAKELMQGEGTLGKVRNTFYLSRAVIFGYKSVVLLNLQRLR